MGNRLFCMAKKDGRDIRSKSKRHNSSMPRSSNRKMSIEEEFIHREAISLAIHQHQQQLSQRYDGGSMSRRIGNISSRRKSLPDSVTNVNTQDPEFLQNLQTKKFVLVHGEGFGAWCWYKTVSLLEEAGLDPTAIDLAGSGINRTDPDSISTLADYAKPLTDYLQKLPEEEKVILVGHSCGGASISYALECYPNKISKAIFVCATMVSDGKQPFDVFVEELGSAEMFKESGFLEYEYGNGKEKPPTSMNFDKQQMKGLYFNQSPLKDIALAAVSMRPIPLGPIMERLSLTPKNYGTGRRFFVQTLDDHALSPDIQEKLLRDNPPEGVFKIKASDHCPFFSKPTSLHKILVEIAGIQ